MYDWQCCLLHLCSLLSVTAVFTSLLLNPKGSSLRDPWRRNSKFVLLCVWGRSSDQTQWLDSWLLFAGSGTRALGQRGPHTGSLYLGLTDGCVGRQSPFRAIKCLYSMKGAGKMMSPHENKVKWSNLICHRPGQNKLFLLIQWTWMGLKSSLVYRLLCNRYTDLLSSQTDEWGEGHLF